MASHKYAGPNDDINEVKTLLLWDDKLNINKEKTNKEKMKKKWKNKNKNKKKNKDKKLRKSFF